jgi:hypothetical protein
MHMGLLQVVYDRLFSRPASAAVVFSLTLLLFCTCSCFYSSDTTLYLTVGAILTLFCFSFSRLKVIGLSLFILATLLCIVVWSNVWLDAIYALALTLFVITFGVCHDLFSNIARQEEGHIYALKEEAILYKNRFNTMVLEHQKREKQKELEIEDRAGTIDLQKERLEKLESILEHQQIKLTELSKRDRIAQNDLQKALDDGTVFQEHCQNIARKFNAYDKKDSARKVPLVALRNPSKSKNKIKLTDLAKNLKR